MSCSQKRKSEDLNVEATNGQKSTNGQKEVTEEEEDVEEVKHFCLLVIFKRVFLHSSRI